MLILASLPLKFGEFVSAQNNFCDVLADNSVSSSFLSYLLSPQTSVVGGFDTPNVRMVLLDGDHVGRLGARRPRFFLSTDAVHLTEAYEVALILLNGSNVAQGCLPHLQAYKLVQAWRLAELGHADLAAKYCESMEEIVNVYSKGSPYFNRRFLESLKDLDTRLSGMSAGPSAAADGKDGGTWLQKFSKFDGWMSALDKGLNKIMNGAVGVDTADSSSGNAPPAGGPPMIPMVPMVPTMPLSDASGFQSGPAEMQTFVPFSVSSGGTGTPLYGGQDAGYGSVRPELEESTTMTAEELMYYQPPDQQAAQVGYGDGVTDQSGQYGYSGYGQEGQWEQQGQGDNYDPGYDNNQGYDSRGYADQGYGEQAYADQGYGDQQGYAEADQGQGYDGAEQPYGDQQGYDQNYGEQGYGDQQGYVEQPFDDQQQQGYGELSYGEQQPEYASQDQPQYGQDQYEEQAGYDQGQGDYVDGTQPGATEYEAYGESGEAYPEPPLSATASAGGGYGRSPSVAAMSGGLPSAGIYDQPPGDHGAFAEVPLDVGAPPAEEWDDLPPVPDDLPLPARRAPSAALPSPGEAHMSFSQQIPSFAQPQLQQQPPSPAVPAPIPAVAPSTKPAPPAGDFEDDLGFGNSSRKADKGAEAAKEEPKADGELLLPLRRVLDPFNH